MQFLTELTKVVSQPILKKLALNNITFQSLVEKYKNEGEKAIIDMLSETSDNKKQKITKQKRVLSKIVAALKNAIVPKKN